MAMYIDDRYLNKEDSDFVELITTDISRFLELASTNESLVLVFPAVSSRHRFLVHKSVEEFPSLCSFSIGEGEQRRPIVCLELAVMRKILGGTPGLVVPDGGISAEPVSTVKPDDNDQHEAGVPSSVTMTPNLDSSESMDRPIDNFSMSVPPSELLPLPEGSNNSLRAADVPLVASSNLPAADTIKDPPPDRDTAPLTSDKSESQNVVESAVCENKHTDNGFDKKSSKKTDGCIDLAEQSSARNNISKCESNLSGDSRTVKDCTDWSDSVAVASAAAAETACRALSASMKETCAIASAGVESDGKLTLSILGVENTAENKCTEVCTSSLANTDSSIIVTTSDAVSASVNVTESSEVRKKARVEGCSDSAECNVNSATDNLPPLDSLIADIQRTVDAEHDASGSKTNGEDLNPALMLELKIAVGDITILRPQNSYCGYLAKELDKLPEGSDRRIEIYDIPDGSITRDLLALFRDYRDKHFDIKWVDNTHAIGIFSTKEMADSVVVDFRHPIVNVQPLSLASTQTKLVAKRSLEFFQAYKPRPQTSIFAARNMLSGALGIRRHSSNRSNEPRRKDSSQEQDTDSDKHKLRKSKDRRHRYHDSEGHSSSSKRRTWDGKTRPCAMDME